MDVNIYEPNPAIEATFASARLRSIVFEIAEIAHALYVEQVAKRTGRLAASAHASTEFGEVYKGSPRWIGVLTVGGRGVDYALPHEFGVGDHPRSIHTLDAEENTIQHAAHDLNRVLEELGAL